MKTSEYLRQQLEELHKERAVASQAHDRARAEMSFRANELSTAIQMIKRVERWIEQAEVLERQIAASKRSEDAPCVAARTREVVAMVEPAAHALSTSEQVKNWVLSRAGKFTTAEAVEQITKLNPRYKDVTVQNEISRLYRSSFIEKLGRGLYQLAQDRQFANLKNAEERDQE